MKSRRSCKSKIKIAAQKGDGRLVYLGISEMEAIGRTWEKSSAVEGDALKSGDGGTDEFLSREKGDLGARSCGERRGKVR